MDRNIYLPLVTQLLKEAKEFYGSRLVTFALFGSFARNEMRPDSDLDILIIAKGLPDGRMRRVAEFMKLENKLEPVKRELAEQNLYPYLSPIFKTPEEANRRSLLFLDMTEEIEIYFDQDDFFRCLLDRFKERLQELGARRIWRGKMWYWVLKPDLKPGETITL